jgi:hypothetical protein
MSATAQCELHRHVAEALEVVLSPYLSFTILNNFLSEALGKKDTSM